MKKKSLALVLCLLLGLSACGGPGSAATGEQAEEPSLSASAPAVSSVSSTEDPSAVPASEAEPEPAPEPDPVPPSPPEGSAYAPAVLMYHLIMEEPYSQYEGLFVRPDDFAAQLQNLNEAGYRYLFANEYHKTDVPSVMLTFDDGYEDNYTTMFPLLKENNVKATIFLITDFIDSDGYLSSDQIREMAQSGYVYFGSHTRSHADLSTLSRESLREQFETSVERIKALTGQETVAAIAYPAGSYNDTVVSVAGEYFDYAYTTNSPKSTAEFTALTIPRFRIDRSLGPNIVSFIR